VGRCTECVVASADAQLGSLERAGRAAAAHPKPGAFVHHRSHRRYAVDYDGGDMWHRERVTAADGQTIATDAGRPVLEIGSGLHAHSYLLRRDGFWVQSPLTWYAAIDGWDLSPGYDPASQATFDRMVTTNCVFCHVGRVEVAGGDPHRFAVVDETIGCQRCHGAGVEHVRHHRTGDFDRESDASKDRDAGRNNPSDDIVHPGTLSRSRQEAICSQCHL